MYLSKCWNGESIPDATECHLVIDDQHLRFDAIFPQPSQSHPDSESGSFQKELWKWDVAELFLRSDKGQYIEINLAPNASWWIAGFSSARVVDSEFDHRDVKVRSWIENNQVFLEVNCEQIASYLGKKDCWSGNMTAILGSPNQRFFSHANLPGDTPDFHQPEFFLPLSEIIDQ